MALLNPQYFDSNIARRYTGTTTPNSPETPVTPDVSENPIDNTYETDKDVFLDIVSSIFGADIDKAIVEELWQGYSKYYKQDPTIAKQIVPDLLIGKNIDGVEVTPLFNKEFETFLKVKADPKSGINTLAEFTTARKEYATLMREYGVGDLATKENLNKFFDQNISYSTAANRMKTAYDAVNNADDFLKQTLGSLNLRNSDLARAIMFGSEGATELSNRIQTAQILAAGLETGYQTSLDVAGIVQAGTSLNRETARAQFAKTKQELGSYTQAAQRAGISTSDLQKELEQENLLGMASQRRKKIQSAEQNLFSGTSGTFQGSLSRNTAGQI
jgi:hypothetical protein